jgi:hypothetical protein
MRSSALVAAALVTVASLAIAPVAGAASESRTSSAGRAGTAVRPIVTPVKVQGMIRRSIAPSLVRNLGEGSTMTVACKTTGRKTLRCVATLSPGDTSLDKIKVIYSVVCVSSVACRWTPIG